MKDAEEAPENVGQPHAPIVDWDHLWQCVHPFGKWQFSILLLFSSFYFFVPAGYLMQSFAATKMEHYCRIDELHLNSSFTQEQQRLLAIPLKSRSLPPTTQSVDACRAFELDYARLAQLPFNEALEEGVRQRRPERTRPCQSWLFNSTGAPYHSSIQKDFRLVCDRAILLPSVQTIIMIGYGIGAVLSGFVADRLGRRPTTLLFVALNLVAGVAISFSPDYRWYVSLRALQTLCSAAAEGAAYVLMMELVGSSHFRALTGNLLYVAFALGYMALPIVAYFVQQWRLLSLAMTVPQTALLIVFWFLPESPRWLASVHRYGDARRVLNQAAKVNGQTMPPQVDLSAFSGADDRRNDGIFNEYLRMLSHRPLLFRTLLVGFNWIANAGLYYGTSLYAVEMGGNAYVNFFLGGLVEIPALVLTIWLFNRYGRRWPLALLLLLYGVAFFGIFIVKAKDDGEEIWQWAVVVLATTAKFCVAATFSMIYIYTVELFPTSVRALALGTSSIIGRIGAAGAPYVRNIGDIYWAPLTPLIFAVVAFAAGASTLLLAETHGRELPQTIDGALRLGKRRAELLASPSEVPLLDVPNGSCAKLKQ